MPDESFPQLAQAAQAGNRAARELLFSRAARLVYARAYRAVGDFEAASDIAQDALIRAVIGLLQLRNSASFLSWLRSIVDRTVAAHRRRAGRERAEALGEVLHAQAESTPEEAAHVRIAAEEVRRAMAALPPRNRLMVELFYFEGMTCAEVAEFLRVSRDAVKTTLSRSRKRLRRSVMSVATAASKPTRITTSMVSGEHHSEGPLFPHDSDIARFYLALYPRGAADKAASEAEVTPQRAQEIVTFLEDRRLPLRVQTSYLPPQRAARICVPSRLMHRGYRPDRLSVTIGPRALLPRAERSTCVQVATPSMELGRM